LKSLLITFPKEIPHHSGMPAFRHAQAALRDHLSRLN
jgi:hypothetical protein